MINKIRIAPKDVVVRENQSKAKRIESKLKMNIKNVLIASLRKRGAVQTVVEGIDIEESKATAVATYLIGNDRKKGTFTFEKNKLKNWVLKSVDASMETAELIIESEDTKEIDNGKDEVIVFDLSQVKAFQHGSAYRLEDPFVGTLGQLNKSQITENNIKTLYILAAGQIGIECDFKGKFNVEFFEEDTLIDDVQYPELEANDEKIEAKKRVSYFVKEKTEDSFAGMRENFEKVIKVKAADLVKKKTTSYKHGLSKIIDIKSYIEIKDNIYSGNILVTAQVGDEITTYALPIENGQIIVKGDIQKYKLDTKTFEDIVKAEMDERLKAKFRSDLETIVADEEHQMMEVINHFSAGRTSQVQQTLKFSKVNMPGVDDGDVLDLQGVKYKVQEGSNPSYWVLSLVDESRSV